ncbi:MAG: PAS domain-containing sensor histidine kinase [Pseudomonadota bacterium]
MDATSPQADAALAPSGTDPAAALDGSRKKRARRWMVSNVMAASALAAAGMFAFGTTWVLLSPSVESINRDLLLGLIFVNVAIALSFMAVISARLWHVWSDRRNQLAGSRTHMQLVGMFAIVAVVPAIVAYLFAFLILRTSLNEVFSNRIDTYIQESLNVSNSYFNEKAGEAALNIEQLVFDLRNREQIGINPARTPIIYRQALIDQAVARDLSAIIVMDGSKKIIAQVNLEGLRLNLPPARVFAELDANFEPGAPTSQRFNFFLNDEQRIDMFRTLLKISNYDSGYVITYKKVTPQMAQRLLAVRDQRDDWNVAKQSRSRIERVFFASYILLAIIILFGAIWLALWAATRIVRPIGRLVGMAEKVSSGELDARVDVQKRDGELGVLARSMNHMTAQLQTQRDDLIETNRQFDARRRFTETVLAGVSAGVVGISENGRITISNRSSAELIGAEPGRLTGKAIADVLPELQPLLAAAEAHTGYEVSDQIDVERDGEVKTLNVRIAADETDGERSFIVTFDDITQLVAAQRSAAWGDVARRIAHEIKNPLTPIQLSAERLRRKYADEITSSPDVFEKCTETIIRHVNDIGRMVDEFSSFARMPKPVIGREDILEIVKSAVFPQRVAFPDIEFSIDGPADPLFAQCDGRLIVQALGNVLKNAGESIGARVARGDNAKGRIAVFVSAGEIGDAVARIDVYDNGVGLPKAERHRLTEPYMTTREKGTGLGLAIVRKVIEEHGGSFAFRDSDRYGPSGAVMTIVLPLDGAAINETRNAASVAAE